MPQTRRADGESDGVMWTLLNPRLWIAAVLVVVLAASHFTAYRAGSASVRQQWDAQITMQAQAMLKASEDARAKEQTLIAKNLKVTHDYIAEKKRGAAAAVVNAGKLRELQSALDSAASADSAPIGGADDPRGRIAGECAATLGILDGYAQEVAAKATALQDYASRVRLTP